MDMTNRMDLTTLRGISSPESREIFLKKLCNDDIFDQYVTYLLDVYKFVNANRLQISPYLDSEIMVMGGMLYFILEREAKNLNLIQDDINLELYKLFKYFKTVDLDLQGALNIDIYDEEESLKYDPEEIKNNAFKVLSSANSNIFKSLNLILDNEPFDAEASLPHNFGFNFVFRGLDEDEQDSSNFVESRPQITVKVGKFEDHIMEMLLLVRENNEYFKIYNLECLKEPFKGEDIIISVTQQIYPNERAWRQINFREKTKEQVFQELKAILQDSPLELIKFNQGFYRVYVISYIYFKAVQHNKTNLLTLMTPTNQTLVNKLFYFKSKNMRLISPLNVLKTANNIYTQIKKDSNIHASYSHTTQFLTLCIDLWLSFNKELNF